MSSTHSKPPCFALVDCNNFYASCEQVFNPKLIGKPVIVLSNNDGCVIARSNEAKMLDIKMGEPFFKVESRCHRYGVQVFSSNFALYGDMSQRVMKTLQDLCPEMEIYSIDEAFLRLDTLAFNSATYSEKIRKTVGQHIGIPVSIGLAPTKTLAKVANHIAKKDRRRGLCDLRDPQRILETLENFPISELWGIGRQWSEQLHRLRIVTAGQLIKTPDHYLRKHFSVLMTRLANELKGVSCLPLETVPTKQNIRCSRSFGQPVMEFSDLFEAISTFTAIACRKARKQKTKAQGIMVFTKARAIHPSKLAHKQQASHMLVTPSNDTRQLIHFARKIVNSLYKKGYAYKKAGIMLLNLIPDKMVQTDLFQTEDQNTDSTLMRILDQVNDRYSQHTIFLGAEGTRGNWRMKQSKRSSGYTTCWGELLMVQ